MIDRYSRSQMKAVWADENRYAAWLEIEILTAEAYADSGIIPMEDAQRIRKNARVDIKRILDIEEITKHDVVAFTRAVSESLGAEKKWVHYGLTSTDVVDTAYGSLYKQANDILHKDLVDLLATLRKKALLYKDVPIIGRTHGIHGEPTSAGLKFALWHEEIKRQMERFDLARRHIEVGKISGAVGNFAHGPLAVEEYVCGKLGLDHAIISTQVLQRDRHANYMATLALIASSLEKMAVEIRHLQRTEVGEMSEFFSLGQKGSSAMPHKKNPIGSENISGCARVIRGYMMTSFENIPLWHERDISHSGSERIIVPDATILLDYALGRFTKILEGLMVFPERMMENLDATHGLIYSQRVLLTLIASGLSREDAYDLIQPIALEAYRKRTSFLELLLQKAEVTNRIDGERLTGLFDPTYYLRNVDSIYQRADLLE